MARKMPGMDAVELQQWLGVDPVGWALEHGPTLRAAGLSAKDAGDLYRRLGPQVAGSLSSLINAGRLADIDIGYVHLWAASGVLRPDVVAPPGRSIRRVSFTAWVTAARRFILACDGDQRAAAHAAAAGLSVDETVELWASGEFDIEKLSMLVAFREGNAAVERDQR